MQSNTYFICVRFLFFVHWHEMTPVTYACPRGNHTDQSIGVCWLCQVTLFSWKQNKESKLQKQAQARLNSLCPFCSWSMHTNVIFKRCISFTNVVLWFPNLLQTTPPIEAKRPFQLLFFLSFFLSFFLFSSRYNSGILWFNFYNCNVIFLLKEHSSECTFIFYKWRAFAKAEEDSYCTRLVWVHRWGGWVHRWGGWEHKFTNLFSF